MKKIITLFVLFTSTLFFAQSSGITYQAVLYQPGGEILPGYNNNQAIMANKDICIRFSIINSTSNVEYQETQNVKTDEFGMVNLLVGTGVQVGGSAYSFNDISWDSTAKKLQVEMDVSGTCSDFMEVSKQDFSALPFAYASKIAENVSGIVAIKNGGTGATTVEGAKTNLGLNNLDNTSDLNKPLSLASQAALNLKENAANKSTNTALGTSDQLFPTQNAVKTYVDNQITAGVVDATNSTKGKIKLTGDLGGTADLPTVPGLANKENTANKSTDGTLASNSDIKFPTEQAVKTYVDAKASTGTTALTNEINRATAAETTLTTNLLAEETRAKAAELVLNNSKEDTANKSTDGTLASNSDIKFPTEQAVKTYVDAKASAGATALTNEINRATAAETTLTTTLLAEETRAKAAELVLKNSKEDTANKSTDGTLASNSNIKFPTEQAVKTYVDTQVSNATPNATSSTLGKIELAGDLAGTGSIATSPIISEGAINTIKLADNSVTNAKLAEIISVKNGGTGSDMSNAGSGFVMQATNGANFTTVSSIPVANINGAVRSVNGVSPAANGNVSVLIGRVFTGTELNPTLATSILNASPAAQESDIYLISESGNVNNGRTFIYDGTNWIEVVSNTAASDLRYVNVAGDTMEGDLAVPTGKKITIADLPSNATDAVNKSYVDNQIIANATPDATTTSKGKVQLAGDLSGTADAPTVPALANKLEGNGTLNFIPKFTGSKTLGNSLLFDTGTKVGIGTTNPTSSFSNTATEIIGSNGQSSSSPTGFAWANSNSGWGAALWSEYQGLNIKVKNTSTIAFEVGSGTASQNDNAGAGGSTPLFKVLTNGNTGIGTTAPANKLEITQGTAGNSGLRFTNLTSASTASTSSAKVLGVNTNGDVILTNVPGTQNIVGFSVNADPNTLGTTFAAASGDTSVIYQSTIDNSMWTYNGTTYVTYTPPASTAWNLANTTNDAGSNKTAAIERTGSIQSSGGSIKSGKSGYIFEMNALNSNGPVLDLGDFSDSQKFWRMGAYGSINNFDTKNRDLSFFSSAKPNALYLKNDTGNIGIGTNNPVTTLHVMHPTRATRTVNADAQVLRLSRLDTNNTKWDNIAQFNLGSYSPAIFDANSRLDLALTDGRNNTTLTNVMTWLANGNVGIGTTAPSSLLHLLTPSSAKMLFETSDGAAGQASIDLKAGGYQWWRMIGQGSLNGGRFDIYNQTGNGSAFSILPNFNVGIGTESPTARFEVATTNTPAIFRRGNTSLGGSNIWLQRTQNTNPNINTAGSYASDVIGKLIFSMANGNTNGPNYPVDGNAAIESYYVNPQTATNAGGELAFKTVKSGTIISTERMRIDENGRVGIGTTFSPSPIHTNTLDVVGGFTLRNSAGNWPVSTGFGMEFNTNSSSPRIDWVANGNYIGQFSSVGNDFFLRNSLDNLGNIRFWTKTSGTGVERLTILNNGYIGIGTTTPVSSFSNTSAAIQGSNTTNAFTGGLTWVTPGSGFSGSFYSQNPGGNGLQVKLKGATSLNNALEISTGDQSTGIVTPLFNVLGNGNVGVGTSTPASKLEVDGAITNKAALNAGGGTTIDFSKSNLAYTTASPSAFTLTNLKDGGNYTLAVRGTTAGTSSFTATGFTFFSANNGTTVSGKTTLYNFMVMGTEVYYTMTSGLQ